MLEYSWKYVVLHTHLNMAQIASIKLYVEQGMSRLMCL